MVASLGGHLEELRLAVADPREDVTWVTSEGPGAASLRQSGAAVVTVARLDRGSVSLRALAASARAAVQLRPRVVVTTGAGLAIPFCLVGRALGAEVFLIESAARVRSASATGRTLRRVAERVYVQWPSMSEVYPEALVCQPLLFQNATDVDDSEPKPKLPGTYVTVGNHDVPFTRMIDVVLDAVEQGVLRVPVVIQAGSAAAAAAGRITPGVSVRDYLPRDDHERALRATETLVSHGGASALATAVKAGQTPIVIARSSRLGEHVDDHQRELISELAAAGLAVECTGPIDAATLALTHRPRESARQLLGDHPRLDEVLPRDVRAAMTRASGRRRARRARPIVAAASLGGHLELLRRALDDSASVTWVTSEGAAAADLRAGGGRVRTVPRLDRQSLSARAVAAGLRVGWALHPSVVITSGAGVAVPLCVVARLRGARIVLIETMARVRTPSRTGRLLRAIASTTVVQWQPLLTHYPQATLCRPELLFSQAPPAQDQKRREGTFVTLGAHDQPFSRLIEGVLAAARDGRVPLPVTIQSGATAVEVPVDLAGQVTVVASVSRERFEALIGDAECVICHGGAGAVATAIRAGIRPLVVVRDPALGEHVDGHQQELVSMLASRGLVVPLESHQLRWPGATEVAGVDLSEFDGLPSAATVLGQIVPELVRLSNRLESSTAGAR